MSIREMVLHMDAEMFLDKYPHWEAVGLHHPLILQEMFLQATHSGWKEAEQMISQGCQHGLPHLDPQADVSAVQSVGYQSTREEIWDLYHKVYKLRRLPGSPPGRPQQVCKLTRDVVSSLKNCLQWRGGEQPRGHEEPKPADTCPSQDRASQRMRWGTSAERELAEAKRGPLVGTGSCHCISKEDREVEPVHHQKQGRLLHPFLELQLTEEKVLGVE